MFSHKIDKMARRYQEKYSEKKLEPWLVKGVEALGGDCFKFRSPGNNSVPDRLVMMPGRRAWFVEVKSTGEAPGALQLIMHAILRRLGWEVFVIDHRRELDDFLMMIQL